MSLSIISVILSPSALLFHALFPSSLSHIHVLVYVLIFPLVFLLNNLCPSIAICTNFSSFLLLSLLIFLSHNFNVNFFFCLLLQDYSEHSQIHIWLKALHFTSCQHPSTVSLSISTCILLRIHCFMDVHTDMTADNNLYLQNLPIRSDGI